MILSATTRCPACGNEIAAGAAPGGLCPRCLLSLGLESDDAAPDTNAPGGLTRLGRYRILELLGSGGMGKVYRAHDEELDRDVAIKVLRYAFTQDSKRLARFRREARLLASLNHPHIAAVYGLEEADGVLFLVLELVEGETLECRIARGDPLSVEAALDLACQMSDALEAAHEREIVHRDLKPANVMIAPRDRVKILDFGIAKAAPSLDPSADSTQLTATGTVVGTTPYMSPEQVRGRPVDVRSDVWSFGCVLYEVLTGRLAFDQPTYADTMSAILNRDPDFDALPSATPRRVRDALVRSLRKNPVDRFASIGEVRAEIEAELAAFRTGRSQGLGARLARRLGATLAVGSVLLGAAIVLVTVTGDPSDRVAAIASERLRSLLSDGGSVAILLLAATTAILGTWALVRRVRGLFRQATPRVRLAIKALGIYLPAAVVLVAAAHALYGWWDARSDRAQDDMLDVYVVLPFEKLNDERLEELVEVTEHYRSTLEAIFADLESVRVMPKVLDAETLGSHPPQCSYRRAARWLKGSELTADIVLCSTVDLFDDQDEHSGVMLVSRVSRVRDERLEPASPLMRQSGSYSEIAWLALQTSFRIARLLTEDPSFELSERDLARVKARILERYGVFLSFVDPDGDAAQRVALALARDTVPDAEVQAALDAYVSAVDLEAYASRNDDARSAFAGRMSGGSP